MKKNYLFLGIVGLALLSSGCNNRQSYPTNPRNGQAYTDDQGNRCVWNSALNYWFISSMVNGRNVNSYYYPNTGSYRNSSGQSISRPVNYSSHSSSFGGESGGYHSGGFGSTGRGFSCGS